MARTRRTKKNNRTASFDGVGKGFAKDQEYLIRVKEVEVEEGDNGLYYSMKLEGTGEFEGSLLYHNASLSPSALWRTREVFEAFLGEVPDGDFDVDEMAEEFEGKLAMCSTFEDEYNGKKSVKIEDFWTAEGVEGGDEGGGEEADVDLDDFDDGDIKKIGKAMGIKSKRASTIRKELETADGDELWDAMVELELVEVPDGEGDGAGDEGSDLDLDELSDDDVRELAKAVGVKRVTEKSRIPALKKKLEALDGDELQEAWDEISEGASGDGEGDEVTAEEINGMNQDELEALVEEHDLDVDLDDHKTLRKKRTAVVDAAEEAEILEED